jgi:chemotaxis receptor (MCP) glutamine deamidase CheD
MSTGPRAIAFFDAESIPSGGRYVGIGEVAESRDVPLTVAGLGSCIAVGMMWPKHSWVTVAHIALPGTGPDVRYAEPAVRDLLERVARVGAPKRLLQTWLIGGAQVIPLLQRSIGAENILSVRGLLLKAGFSIHVEDVGGHRGRTAVFDPRNECARVYYLGSGRAVSAHGQPDAGRLIPHEEKA